MDRSLRLLSILQLPVFGERCELFPLNLSRRQSPGRPGFWASSGISDGAATHSKQPAPGFGLHAPCYDLLAWISFRLPFDSKGLVAIRQPLGSHRFRVARDAFSASSY